MFSRMLVIAFGAGFLFAPPAFAVSQQDRDACQSKDPAAAIAGCSSIIGDAAETPQGRADAYVFRAAAYLAQGNADRAIADYGEALKLSPRDFAAYVGRALVEFKNGQKDAAILDYSIADKLNAGAVALIVPGNADLRQIADAARASPPPANALALVDQLPQTAAAPATAPPPPCPRLRRRPLRHPRCNPKHRQPHRHRHRPRCGIRLPRRSGGFMAVSTSPSAIRDYDKPKRTQDRARWTPAVTAAAAPVKSRGAWNFGCVYITTGSTRSRAGWGSGNSEEAALSKCREDGLSCKKPIGGCVD